MTREIEDDGLDSFLNDVRSAAEEHGARPRRDFMEVIRRAQAMAPEAIDDSAVEVAATLAEVVSLGPHSPEPEADPELDAFIADVAANNAALAEQRRMVGIPDLTDSGERRPARRLFAGALAVAATLALVLLGDGPESALQGTGPVGQAMSRHAATIAEEVSEVASVRSRTPERAPEPAANTVPAEQPEEPEADGAPDEIAGEGDTATDATEGADVERPGTRKPAPKRPRLSKAELAEQREDELAALDAEAQRRWRAGDLPGAEAAFRELLSRDPRGRWAQLAYGDLFVLARQAGDPSAELALWREYLRRHPRGPHADYAHVGVCRRSAGADGAACWRDYLAKRPQGSFRAEAEAAVTDTKTPESRLGELDDEALP